MNIMGIRERSETATRYCYISTCNIVSIKYDMLNIHILEYSYFGDGLTQRMAYSQRIL